MKLCQVVPSLEERHGGPSRSVHALSYALAQIGHDVELMATQPEAPEERTTGTLRLRIFRRDWPERLCPSAGLNLALQASGATVFHHHALWLRTLHYTHRAARQKQATFVLSPRGMMSTWAWQHRGWRKKFARAMVHPGALDAVDGWHATSAEEEAEIRKLGFTQPICVAPNGVDAPLDKEIKAATEHWHSVCPAVTKRPVALFYSRFHLKKRVLELVDLWLQHAPSEWLLLLVGIPQDYTPDMIERYVLRASGGGRVQVFAGSGRPPPYAAASLFLLPSHNENFGMAVAEAMAHGLPVVVTDTTPWSGVNIDGRGWCVPWLQFPEAVRAATSEDASRLRARGARAREWVLREFAWEKSARLLTDFYGQLRRRAA